MTAAKFRVNLFAGPGAGKTTTALKLTGELKERGFNAEYAPEFVKDWAYLGRTPGNFDQINIFGNQMHRETIPLENGIDIIVTDSPLYLSVLYSHKYCPDLARPLSRLCDLIDDKYEPINIFIDRAEKPYNPIGRFQTAEEARELDEEFRNQLYNWYGFDPNVPGSIATLPYHDYPAIVDHVLTRVGQKKNDPKAGIPLALVDRVAGCPLLSAQRCEEI